MNDYKRMLIDWFEQQPQVIDPDLLIYAFTKTDTNGYKILFYTVMIENNVCIKLTHKDLDYSLYNLDIEFITMFEVIERTLLIKTFDNKKTYRLSFEPNFLLTIDLE